MLAGCEGWAWASACSLPCIPTSSCTAVLVYAGLLIELLRLKPAENTHCLLESRIQLPRIVFLMGVRGVCRGAGGYRAGLGGSGTVPSPRTTLLCCRWLGGCRCGMCLVLVFLLLERCRVGAWGHQHLRLSQLSPTMACQSP